MFGGIRYTAYFSRKTISFVQILIFLMAACSAHGDYSPEGVSGAFTVSVFDAKSLYDKGAIFIDVRNREEWRLGHIEGAIHLDFQHDFSKLYSAGVSKETPIVLYCSSSNCLRSAYASAVSVYWGFKNVFYFRGGFFAWMLEDFPVVLSTVAIND